MNVEITPSTLQGEITCPSSKSYAHRILIASFLSGETTIIKNISYSDDVLATAFALESLGAIIEKKENEIIISRGELPKSCSIFCNESGSTLRFLLPVVAALGIKAEFTGKEGLMRRPMDGLVSSLNSQGAKIEGLKINGLLKSGVFEINAEVSSQYVSGLLFALPLLNGDSEIRLLGNTVSKDYIILTIDVLKSFGISVEKTDSGYFIRGCQKYRSSGSVTVEGDYSNAAFYLGAGAIDGKIKVKGLNAFSSQGDKRIIDILKDFGANVVIEDDCVSVSHDKLKGTIVDVTDIPDLAQIISTVAAFADGETKIVGTARLKIKESDRLNAIVDSLTAAGISVKVEENAIVITGGHPSGGKFTGGNDHRTVMSAAVLAAYAKGNSIITDASAVNKSYPKFFNDYTLLGGKVRVDV